MIQFCSLPVLITFLLSYTGESYSQQTDVLSSVWSEGLLCLEILSQWQVSTRPVWVGRWGELLLRNTEKVDKIFAAIVAKIRIKFYFLHRLRQQQNCETSCCLGMLHLSIFSATCIATKLPDKFHEKLLSVIALYS